MEEEKKWLAQKNSPSGPGQQQSSPSTTAPARWALRWPPTACSAPPSRSASCSRRRMPTEVRVVVSLPVAIPSPSVPSPTLSLSPHAEACRRIFVAKAAEAIRVHKARWLVVGWPLEPPGMTEGPGCRAVASFVARLRSTTPPPPAARRLRPSASPPPLPSDPGEDPAHIPVVFWDETGTTSRARDRVRDALAEAAAARASTPALGAVRRRQVLAGRVGGAVLPAAVDAEAAVAILESFLAAARREVEEAGAGEGVV